MAQYRVGIAGKGRVGSAIFEHLNYYNPFILKRKKEIEKYKFNKEIDIWVLCLPDNAILKYKDKFIKNSNIVTLHTSGTLPKIEGIEKIHPFAMIGENNINDLSKIYWGVHKNEENAKMFVEDIIKGNVFYLPNEYDPILYHTAAVLSSSLFFALEEISSELFDKINIDEKTAILSIMEGTLNAIKQNEPKKYLAGPIIRNDTKIIEKETEKLKKINPLYSQVYDLLSQILKNKI